jgi:uncharacterized membrane protein
MLTRVSPDRAAFVVALLFVVTGCLGLVVGSPAAFRNPHLALAVALTAVAARAPETFARPLSPRAWRGLVASALVWCALASWSHWAAFRVNGVDFSIFDWMLESTHQGRLGYSPIYDVNHFGVHSTFLLLLLVPLHALAPSPLWLVGVGSVAVWAGCFPLRRLARSLLGVHGGLELTLMLAWLGSSWLGYGVFRIESLTPVFTLWFLVGWVEKRRGMLGAAALAMLCTKEDAALALASFAVASLLVERRRWPEALAVLLLATTFLATYVGWLQPLLLGKPAPTYLHFWSDFGQTAPEILRAWLSSPAEVAVKLFTSRWYLFFGPLLLLPFLSVQGAAGLLPTFFLLGVSNYDHMRDYGGYYPSPMVAWALFGMLEVAARTRHRRRWWLATVAGLLAFPLFQGDPARSVVIDWRVRAGLPAARAALAEPASVRCVQTVLMPHLGYPSSLVPLFDDGCLDRPGAAGLLHPQLDLYPQPRERFDRALERLSAAGRTRDLPGGFVYVAPAPLASRRVRGAITARLEEAPDPGYEQASP